MKKLLSKALSVVLAFSIGVLPIQSQAAGVGNGAAGNSSSWLDTTQIQVESPPVCVECAFENNIPGDLTSEEFCGRNRCHALGTPAGDDSRVNVAVVDWVTVHHLTEKELRQIQEDARQANLSPEKSWNLPQVLSNTSNKSLPEAALNNFRSLRAINKQTTAGAALVGTAVAPSMREQAGPPMLVSTFASSDGALHIEAIRTVRPLGGGLLIQQADITPHHFDLFKITQAYTTKDEQLAGKLGRNPFEFAKSSDGADDRIFRRLSLGGAKVAMGLAMRQVGASFGLMTITKDSWRSWTTKSGNFWNKKTTYHTGADTESIYYAFTPATTVYAGDDAALCANNPDVMDCDPALAVRSGVTASQWVGGTFKDIKQQLTYHHQKTVSQSFNFLKVIIIAVLIVVTVGYLAPIIAGAMPFAAAGAAGTAGATTLSLATTVGNAAGYLLGAEAGAFVTTAMNVVTAISSYGGTLLSSALSSAGMGASWATGVGMAWSYGVGEVISYANTKGVADNPENEHVLAHNRNLRNHIRKNVRDVAQRFDGVAPDQVSAGALGDGSESMNNVMVPSGSIDMFVQRGRLKTDNHAERVVDIEADLEMSAAQ